MTTRCEDATVERARRLIEGSERTLEDIAVEVGVSVPSLRAWIKKNGWRRPPGAPRAVPKLPPEKEGPARRLYEGGAAVADIAGLLACHGSYVHRIARRRGWRRPEENTAAADGPAFAESEGARAAREAIAARLREPDLSRPELLRLLQGGLALTLVEAFERATDVEGRVEAAVQLARLASELPEDPPAPRTLSPEEQERESAALLDELTRRLGAYGPSDGEAAGAAF